jgi:hypothetical protein
MITRPAVALALLLAAGGAYAGRPMATEDAGVLDRGACELESFIGRVTVDDLPSAHARSLQLGCGFGYDSQLAFAVAEAKADGLKVRTTTLLGKTALNTPAENTTAFTLAWGLAWAKPDDGSNRHEVTFLNGVATHPLSSSLKLHANLGWSRSQSAKASTTNWNLGLEKSYAGGIDAMAEVFATDRDNAPWVQFAVRWAAIPDKLFLDGSWGVQTGSGHAKALTLGLKVPF